jgi:hypothetical protein
MLGNKSINRNMKLRFWFISFKIFADIFPTRNWFTICLLPLSWTTYSWPDLDYSGVKIFVVYSDGSLSFIFIFVQVTERSLYFVVFGVSSLCFKLWSFGFGYIEYPLNKMLILSLDAMLSKVGYVSYRFNYSGTRWVIIYYWFDIFKIVVVFSLVLKVYKSLWTVYCHLLFCFIGLKICTSIIIIRFIALLY